MATSQNSKKRSDLEFEESETDSTESAASSYCNVPELKERPVLNKEERMREIGEDFLDLEERILRGTVELEEAWHIIESKKRNESETFPVEENNSVSRHIGNEIAYGQANEKRFWESQNSILRKTLELEEESKKRLESAALKSKERNSSAGRNEDNIARQDNENNFLESQNRILRKTLELEEESKKILESAAWKSKERNSASGLNAENTARQAYENKFLESQNRILRKTHELEEELKNRLKSAALKPKERNSAPGRSEGNIAGQANENKFLEALDRNLRKIHELVKKRKESAALKLKEMNSAPGRNEENIARQADKNKFLEVLERNLRNTLELGEEYRKRKESEDLKERNSAPGPSEDKFTFRRVNEKSFLESQDANLRKVLALEESFEKRKQLEALKVLESHSVARQGLETQIPLLEEESVTIDLADGIESSNVDQVKLNPNRIAALKKVFRSLSLIEGATSVSSTIHQIKNSKWSSTSAYACCKGTMATICSAFLIILGIAAIFIVPIAMVVIGSIYIDKCTVQPYIPIYLLVCGAWGLFYNFIGIFKAVFCDNDYGCFDGVISLFLIIWFIVGCVWVYGVWVHVEFDDPNSSEYCHRTLYYFAFWFLNCIFILLGIPVLVFLCAACCAPFL